jgi:hypothetical protein
MSSPTPAPATSTTALKLWFEAYRVEVFIFAVAFAALAMFSGQRFLRQSGAPHFVYQSKAFLEGRLDIDAEVLPNFEDWACVRQVNNVPTRCTRPLQPGDKWFSSFPWFPSVVMAPFVALHGYQFNDTSFGVIVAALALALFYWLLRTLTAEEASGRAPHENVALALLLGFGTLFWYCAIRGEVWFSAEVMGVAFTALYVRNALGARRPVLAGAFWSMAVLTRTPLVFTGLFFFLEAVAPTRGERVKELKAFFSAPGTKWRPLRDFVLGAAPLGALAVALNLARFGHVGEFGHSFFFENRVNRDIDSLGLFNVAYLLRDLDAAFLKLPMLKGEPLKLFYDAWGLSLFITLPTLALLFTRPEAPKRAWALVGAMVAALVTSALFPPLPGGEPIGSRMAAAWVVLAGTLATFVYVAWLTAKDTQTSRLFVPLCLTVVACAAPGLLYQNSGYAQFGFRFSLDYTPYLMLLLAVSGWNLKKPLPLALAALAVVVNFWGAVGFSGYTELIRGWH